MKTLITLLCAGLVGLSPRGAETNSPAPSAPKLVRDFHFEGPGVAKRADDQTLEIRPTTNRFRSFWGGGRGKLDEANDLDRITSYLQEVGRVDLRRLYEDIWY